ncbi:guanylate kinase [Marichromatium bheemlicum]|uniref:Guanylate kinase n=1 Tax=Marichromatium bheemlicum TaxID=365339 RepID=A0ABX1I6Z3_9GAMM|nr:guanylate kinase [Marichromatium bheemlicum]NKN32963.1 guanylate kinase [Marichromatium bheemlicum]
MGQGILFIVSAPSGAGKTSLVRALLERDRALALSVSCTTRAPRTGERDGVHYHFLARERFEQAIAAGDFLESAEVFGNLYGTREQDVRARLEAGEDLILEIDWQGARQVRARIPEAVSIFVLPPSITELERRLRGRGTDSDTVIAERMAQARDEMIHGDEYDYLVVNGDFEDALTTLTAIIAAERQRQPRQQPKLTELLGD